MGPRVGLELGRSWGGPGLRARGYFVWGEAIGPFWQFRGSTSLPFPVRMGTPRERNRAPHAEPVTSPLPNDGTRPELTRARGGTRHRSVTIRRQVATGMRRP